MNVEHPTRGENPRKKIQAETDVLSAEGFDLTAFFQEETEIESKPETDLQAVNLLVTLKADAQEVVPTLQKQIKAETFTVGVQLTLGVLSQLTGILGSCGMICAHTLQSLAQSSGGLGSALAKGPSGKSNTRRPDIPVTVNQRALVQKTGAGSSDLRSPHFWTSEIWQALLQSTTQGLYQVFGFGLLDCVLSRVLPGGRDSI